MELLPLTPGAPAVILLSPLLGNKAGMWYYDFCPSVLSVAMAVSVDVARLKMVWSSRAKPCV